MNSRGRILYKRFSAVFLYISAVVLRRIFLLLPLSAAVRLGGILGRLGFYLDKTGSSAALDNIPPSYPSFSSEEVLKLCLDAYENQGKNFAEFVSFPKYDRRRLRKLIAVEGADALAAAHKRGRGTMIITAHFGNWELLGAVIADMGYPLTVMAKKFYVPEVNDIIVGNRSRMGINLIMRATEYSARDIIKVLRANHFLGMIIDQDTQVPGDFVEFFGREAYTPVGAAAIALKMNCSVIYAFMERESLLGHRAFFEPVELIRTGDEKKDILENTRAFTARIEHYVRRRPEQWVWYHKRWKTKR
ncbi:MAG: lysophospholipid acyltransferase family protein, partial [Endomicrobiia bacterium]|nr:lysophospholipid acyltransferase family protein [Endomicrobiia bacterium]